MRSWERFDGHNHAAIVTHQFVVILALISPHRSHDRVTIVVLNYLPSVVRWRSGKLGDLDRTITMHHDRVQHLEHPLSDSDPRLMKRPPSDGDLRIK